MCELNNGARNSTVTEARATSETRQSAKASKKPGLGSEQRHLVVIFKAAHFLSFHWAVVLLTV